MAAKIKKIEINDQFKKALDLMGNTNKSLFITGKAGTGKSTLLDYYCKNSKKNPAILAPTGIAALNGTRGSTYDALVYSAAIALWHLKKYDDIKAAADKVREVLDNGDALQHFNAAQ